jgi:hypothetical protein
MSHPAPSNAEPIRLTATQSHREARNSLISGALELNLMPFDQDPVEEYRWKILTPLIESSRGEPEASSVARTPIELHGNIGVFWPFALLYTP